METRRSFLKKAGILSGAAGMLNALPESLQKALAINPAPGTTFYDAEHIVFLMQENRSFDHAFGTLQGVRGFNDPRAISLPNAEPVWIQTNDNGESYTPFPFDIKNSKITWMGSLPHSWTDQVDAYSKGDMDKWLQAKTPGKNDYKHLPLTMGYYSRADIPFYYAMADAFTICDHNFCSSLTGTTPNRLYFWSGTIREKMEAQSQANVWNSDADYGGGEVNWKTYPERLEEHGVSWKVYQNEIYSDIGLGDSQAWLDNFGDNPLEYFPHYHVRMTPEYIAYIPQHILLLQQQVAELQAKLTTLSSDKEKSDTQKSIASKEKRIAELKEEQKQFTPENFEKLSAYHKSIHAKAFSNNREDIHYHDLTILKYKEGDKELEMEIPKGDILYQFRKDVQKGELPTVSWLAAPEKFSDHPSAPWFGAWYISEVLDILTQNPEVWKKTIFIVTYDENDGYFDHFTPFAPPNPYQPQTGKVSAGIDTTVEYVRKDEQSSETYNRESNIGLGFRVPMIVASPWSRGGYVCSEVFDHTSSLQFLEKFLEKKTGKKIMEDNISTWRRTICGDVTSVFRPYNGEKIGLPVFVEKEKFLASIHQAQFKELPNSYRKLSEEQIEHIIRRDPRSVKAQQEKGIRDACALPYELYVNAGLTKDRQYITVKFEAGDDVFGAQSAGAPFYVYMGRSSQDARGLCRNYAVKVGDVIDDKWPLGKFLSGLYSLRVHGPNGFYRSFQGGKWDPQVDIYCGYEKKEGQQMLTGHLQLVLSNHDDKVVAIMVSENYSKNFQTISLSPGESRKVIFNLSKSFGWYDLQVKTGREFGIRYQFAGHIETGQVSKTDPLMGAVLE